MTARHDRKDACRPAVILQARMGSQRLPGKVLRLVAGKPMLEWCLLRLADSQRCRRVIVATSTAQADDAVENFCAQRGTPCFRGSEDDVLLRYYEAAQKFQTDPVIRITADCPLIDARVLDDMLAAFAASDADYLSNTLERTFPLGLDVEIFSSSALLRAQHEATQRFEREHVTPFFYQHPERFKLASFKHDADWSHLRVTVDTHEDWQVADNVYSHFIRTGRDHFFSLEELLQLHSAQPELFAPNREVRQKHLGE
ncbi:MAG: glycosyltransferase family protein [candidate division KSB1 bacterium]